MPITDRMLKTADACEALNISRTGLWRMQRAGQITPVHLVPGGRTVRFRESDINKVKGVAS